MKINPDEITSILKSRIEGLDSDSAVADRGRNGAFAVRRHRPDPRPGERDVLRDARAPHDVVGLALNLESDNVGAVLFGEWEHIVEGDTVRRTGRLLEIPVGEALLGRIVYAARASAGRQGRDRDHRDATGRVQGAWRRPAPAGQEPMQTGIKAIDSMIPIGRGQRELIIGDRQTGKTAIAIDTIINNRDTGVVSVYVAIGQRGRPSSRSPRRCASTARWRTRSSSPPRPTRRRRSSSWRPTRAARWPSTSSTAAATRSASTTTSPSTPTPTGRCRCCCAARRAARPTPATYSTCTRACWSAR